MAPADLRSNNLERLFIEEQHILLILEPPHAPELLRPHSRGCLSEREGYARAVAVGHH